eukprot:4268572-Pyramimonas_sp.AAC.1
MFTNPKNPRLNYPQLKGKAAEIKNIIAPRTEIFGQWMEQGDEIHEQLHLALRMNSRMEELL